MLNSERLFKDVGEACSETLAASGITRDALSSCLSRTYETIRTSHLSGMGGKVVCAAHALVIDRIVEYLYRSFLERRKKRYRSIASKFCVVALGGYGRSELSPKSDIDILFLYDSSVSTRFKGVVIDEISYPLWDLGLKLGHSSRTYREALADARKDILLRNSMLDARLICGDSALYKKFTGRFDTLCAAKKKEHFDELMRLKLDRHAKFGWTPYLQEPNVKNGIGGLRDAQTMIWKTHLNFGSNNLRELASRSIISISEFKSVWRAYDFLLRVRNDMHYHFERANDLLDLETQPKIAEHLGFRAGGEIERIEEFMRKVYSSFRAIDSVAKTARKRMGLSLPGDVEENMYHLGTKLPGNKKFNIGGFSFYRGEAQAAAPNVFKKDPAQLVKVFGLFQEYGAVPSDRLEVLIKDSRHLIDDAVRSDPSTNSAFLSILQKRGGVFPALELMHYWGVLGAFIPEFKDITCMVQHEFYHRYTADIHILNTIAQLDKIFCARESDGLYWEYHKVLVSSPSPTLLYLMLFLHDIGKGDGIRGHAEIGAEIGAEILRRLGVPDSDSESVLFIVKNHLQMARFWQSYDVEDEVSIGKFASIVKNEELLKYLYVLTFCDAMGTAEGFWNSYKQSLHSSLYTGTLAYLQKKQSHISIARRKAKVLSEALSDPNSRGLESLVVEQMENLPRNYFLFHGRNDLLMHVKMIRELQLNARKGQGDMPIIEWRDEPNDSISRLYVVSTDRSGLFATLAGVVTLSGFDILGSKIFTRDDGITLDAFYVRGICDGIAANPKMKARFEAEVRRAIAERESLDKRVDEMFYSDNRHKRENVVSDVFMRRESKKLVVEIRARDRIGLLYKIARAIDSCGYDIVFARVNTERVWAQDSFHLAPRPLAESPAELAKTLRNLV